MEMTVVDEGDQITHVQLSGRLDMLGVDKIDLPFTAAVASRRRPAMIGMAEVSFLSSLGIRTLLSTAKALQRSGAVLVLYGVQSVVTDVLTQAGLAGVLPVYADAAAARDALTSGI